MYFKHFMRRIRVIAVLIFAQLVAVVPIAAQITMPSGVKNVGVKDSVDAYIYDISWKASREKWGMSNAYAVVPKTDQIGPGILYFHQLGMQRDRQQFLREVLLLSKSGVRAVLINGNAPWSEGWKGTVEDVDLIEAQMNDVQVAIAVLEQLPSVDPQRLGFVGHDYGAMFGGLLYSRTAKIKAVAHIAGAPEFGDWIFFFNSKASQDKSGYNKLLGDRNPIDSISNASGSHKKPLLLQFYPNDNFVEKPRAEQLIAATAEAAVQWIPSTSHNGIAAAGKDQRLAWLLPLLGTAYSP